MNTHERWRRGLVPAMGGLLVGLVFGVNWPLTAQAPVRPPQASAPQAPAAFPAEAPAARGYDANLYMQTAAEYRACCYQAYNLATRRVHELKAEAKGDGKPLAVVMDLDETVLDNAGFQAMLLRSGLTYDQRLWDMWEGQYGDYVGLIPGAKEFIKDAEKQGVTIVHISNRIDDYRSSTECALKRLGIPAKPEHIKLNMRGASGDKTKRRQDVEKDYRVLLYVGDNLRDFDEKFRSSVDKATPETEPAKLEAAIRERKDKVDGDRDKWGREWVILPNPAYGEWTKPLGLGSTDLDRLVPVGKKPPTP